MEVCKTFYAGSIPVGASNFRSLKAKTIVVRLLFEYNCCMSRRSWTDEQLMLAVAESRSYRMVIKKLGLVPAGGNYVQVQKRIKDLALDTTHFTGMGWDIGLKFVPRPAAQIESLLVAIC